MFFLHCTHLDGLSIQEDEAGGQGHGSHHPEDEVDTVGDESVAGVGVSALLHQVGLHLALQTTVGLQSQDGLVLQLVGDAGVRVGEEGDVGLPTLVVPRHIGVDSDQLQPPLTWPHLAVLGADLAADDGLVGDGHAEVGLGEDQV